MNIFLAGRYERRDELAGYAIEAEALGYTVTARWLRSENHPEYCGFTAEEITTGGGIYDAFGFIPSDKAQTIAGIDGDDLLSAQIVVFFTEHPETAWPRGARNVELGMVQGWNVLLANLSRHIPAPALWAAGFTPKQIILVGYRENIYEVTPNLQWFPTWEDTLDALRHEHAESALTIPKPVLVGPTGSPLVVAR